MNDFHNWTTFDPTLSTILNLNLKLNPNLKLNLNLSLKPKTEPNRVHPGDVKIFNHSLRMRVGPLETFDG